MRRKMLSALIIAMCVIFALSVNVFAQTYELSGTDLQVRVDDTYWYVFTRDNIVNNAELEELGISYEYMYNVFHNNAVYMDAILIYDNGEFTELFIRKKTLDGSIVNLSNYEDDKVMELASSLAERQGATDYSVYTNNYKFARSEYIDSSLGYYICEFVTVVNKDNYTLTFQSTSKFDEWEYEQIEDIVNSIVFDVDTTLKEPENTPFWENVLKNTLGGALIGGAAGGVISFFSKKKRKARKDAEAEIGGVSEEQ